MAEVTISEILGQRLNGPMYGSQNVKFYYEWVEDPAETKKHGRPIAFEREMIQVTSSHGERTCVPVNDRHRKDYKAQYEIFLELDSKPTSGSPLFEWAMMPRNTVIEFAWRGIKTVEQVAALEKSPNLGTLLVWVQRAADYIEGAKAPKNAFVKLKEDNATLEVKLQKALDQISVLCQRIEATEGGRFSNVTA